MSTPFHLWRDREHLRWQIGAPAPSSSQEVLAATLWEAALASGLLSGGVGPGQWFVVWQDRLLEECVALPAEDLTTTFAGALHREGAAPLMVRAEGSIAAIQKVFGPRKDRCPEAPSRLH